MSDSYVERKARDALNKAKGDRRDAAQLLATWVEDDVRLKNGLIRPFLANICRLAIQRAEAGDRPSMTGGKRPRESGPTAIDDVVRSLLGTSGKAAPKKRPDPAIPQPAPRPVEASGKHQRTMQALASSFKKRPRS
jgi:hypothetical protein